MEEGQTDTLKFWFPFLMFLIIGKQLCFFTIFKTEVSEVF